MNQWPGRQAAGRCPDCRPGSAHDGQYVRLRTKTRRSQGANALHAAHIVATVVITRVARRALKKAVAEDSTTADGEDPEHQPTSASVLQTVWLLVRVPVYYR